MTRSEQRIEALRQDPDFRVLVSILKGQTPPQMDRLSDYLEHSEHTDGGGHGRESR